MSIFQKLFKNKNAVKKDKAIAFVDYEHWYYSIQKNFGLKPEPVSWRRKLEEQYDLEDVMVFADFGHKGIDGELTKLRNMTNTIIETQQTFSRYKKDMTDFIMLDYIYQVRYHDIYYFYRRWTFSVSYKVFDTKVEQKSSYLWGERFRQ